MKQTILLLLGLSGTCLSSAIPPPHPAVVAVRREEETLPHHLRKPAIFNERLWEVLPITSQLHHGETPVYERQADKIERREIYSMLTHAGFVRRSQTARFGHQQQYGQQQRYGQQQQYSHQQPYLQQQPAHVYIEHGHFEIDNHENQDHSNPEHLQYL